MVDILYVFSGSPLLYALVLLLMILVTTLILRAFKLKYKYIFLGILIIFLISFVLLSFNNKVQDNKKVRYCNTFTSMSDIAIDSEETSSDQGCYCTILTRGREITRIPDSGKLTGATGWVRVIEPKSRNNYLATSILQGYSVQQTSEGGYILAGREFYIGGDEQHSNVYFTKLDNQGNIIFERNIKDHPPSGNDNLYARAVQQTSDGGYILVGGYRSYRLNDWSIPIYSKVKEKRAEEILARWPEFNVPKTTQNEKVRWHLLGNEVYLTKIDADGNVTWERTLGDYFDEEGYSVQQTSDGGYIIAGRTSSYGISPYTAKELMIPAPNDIYIIKTDANGTLLWEKVYGGKWDDAAYLIKHTSDGGYIVAGSTISSEYCADNRHNYCSTEIGWEDAYLLKLDKDGNKVWEKSYGGNESSEIAFSVQQTFDGGYIFVGQRDFINLAVGSTTGRSYPNQDIYVVRTDTDGNLLWKKTYGRDMIDAGQSIQQTVDGGFIIGGITNFHCESQRLYNNQNLTSPFASIYLLKINTEGDVMWEKAFGIGLGSVFRIWGGEILDPMHSVIQTFDGGYLIVGDLSTPILINGTSYHDHRNVYIIKTDENGNI